MTPPKKPEDFIRTNAVLMPPLLVPEISLYLATEVVPLWRKTEDELAAIGVPPPFWAFAWAGGQALARYVLDNPATVAGKRVLDMGAGSGLVGIAAAKAGAAHVLSADIDAFAVAAIRLNAAVNGVDLAATADDVIGSDGDWDVVLVGDLFYERPLAERLLNWTVKLKAVRDRIILLGDPGRNYFPRSGITRLASYSVPVSRELEDRDICDTAVYRLD